MTPGTGDADPLTALAPVAAAAALGLASRLETAIDDALHAGCGAVEIRETLLVVSLFAGFPRTLDALAVARRVFARRLPGGVPAAPEPGLPRDDAARREVFRTRGRALFDCGYGESAGQVFGNLLDLDPELPHWVVSDAYGRVLARPGLEPAERERLAVVRLAALTLRNQLSGHVRGALNCGARPEAVLASLAAASDLLPDAELEAARASVERYRSTK